MKIKLLVLLLVFSLFTLSGCGVTNLALTPITSVPVNTSAPRKLVEQLDISFYPDNPCYTRHYYSEENINALLALLRSFQSDNLATCHPKADDGQSYYIINVTYANNLTHQYYLMGHRYLRIGDNHWIEVGTDNAKKFVQFLNEHPNDISINHIQSISDQKLCEIN